MSASVSSVLSNTRWIKGAFLMVGLMSVLPLFAKPLDKSVQLVQLAHQQASHAAFKLPKSASSQVGLYKLPKNQLQKSTPVLKGRLNQGKLEKSGLSEIATISKKPDAKRLFEAKAALKKSNRVTRVSYKPTVTASRFKVDQADGSKKMKSDDGFFPHKHFESTNDPLNLRARVALVIDQNTWTTQYAKNMDVSLPVASITKLMTAMVTIDAVLDMNEILVVTRDDADFYHSRLIEGTQLTRQDALLLALMSSENRAAHVLARTYPGGIPAFVLAMNAKAKMLGMESAYFVDPAGLSSANQANAMDLARMVNAASQYDLIRKLSTLSSATIEAGNGMINVYVNSNRLISRNMGWDIGMQKTGTLKSAGKCLVVQTKVNNEPKIIVLLGSLTVDSRVDDAVRIKNWLHQM